MDKKLYLVYPRDIYFIYLFFKFTCSFISVRANMKRSCPNKLHIIHVLRKIVDVPTSLHLFRKILLFCLRFYDELCTIYKACTLAIYHCVFVLLMFLHPLMKTQFLFSQHLEFLHTCFCASDFIPLRKFTSDALHCLSSCAGLQWIKQFLEKKKIFQRFQFLLFFSKLH